jgi:hypothetical protein
MWYSVVSMNNNNSLTIDLGNLTPRARVALKALLDALRSDDDGDAPDAINLAGEVAQAVKRTRRLKVGEEFRFSDVCDLGRLAPGMRKVLGRMYRQAVEGAEPSIARFVRRSKDRHAIYERLA